MSKKNRVKRKGHEVGEKGHQLREGRTVFAIEKNCSIGLAKK